MKNWLKLVCLLAVLGAASFGCIAWQKAVKKRNLFSTSSKEHASSHQRHAVTPELLEANKMSLDKIESLKIANEEAIEKRQALIKKFKELSSSSSVIQAREQAINSSKVRYLELMKSLKLDSLTMDKVFEVIRERTHMENRAFDDSLERGETVSSNQQWAEDMAQATKVARENLVALLGNERAEEFLFVEEHVYKLHRTPLTNAAAQSEVNRQLQRRAEN